MKKTELLSPAGSFDALRAAVLNGADAVYLGASHFSARSSAANFSDDELPKASDFCHLRGAKAYLAVNTLLLEREFHDFCKLIRIAARCGIDGCIVQDMGAARIIREVAPDMPVHASTQMTVHSLEGVRLMEKEGFKRIVLSRELSKNEIEYICKNTNTETEVFVHGALCICYSGKCLLSSAVGGRSGNRGKCAQPCRLKYTMNSKSGYLLSPADLCLVNEIETLKKMGVSSLKIEGRMKSPEYVAVVTSVYRKVIDSGTVSAQDMDKLRGIFCRGNAFTDAYFTGNGEENLINSYKSNDGISRKADVKLLQGASKSFAQGAEYRRISLDMTLYAEDSFAVLKINTEGVECVCKAPLEDTPPLSTERALQQLSKLGAYPFKAGEIVVSGQINLKISSLNALRREGAQKISDLICGKHVKKTTNFMYERAAVEKEEKMIFAASVRTPEQAYGVAKEYKTVCIPSEYYMDAKNLAENCNIYMLLPTIIAKEYVPHVRMQIENAAKAGIKGLVCNSMDAVAIALSYDVPVIGGYGLNVTNGLSAQCISNMGVSAIVPSAELSLGDVKSLAYQTSMPIGFIAYGRLALMQTKHCFMKGMHCGSCEAGLTDRTGAVFPVRRALGGHGNVIYNSRPIYLADKPIYNIGASFAVMCFTVEKPNECREIIRMYKKCEKPSFDFTRGGQSGKNW